VGVNNYTIADVLRKTRTSQRVNKNRVAVHFGERAITYEDLDERSDRLASGLLRAGFRKGDRAAVMMHNRPEWIEIFFAVAKVGGVLVPVNHLLREREVKHLLDDGGAAWVLTEDRFWPIFDGLRTPEDGRSYLTLDAHADGALAYEAVVASGTRDVSVDVDVNDLFLLQYTSGTTGRPKGAMHTHSTVLWNSFYQMPEFGVTADDVYLILPALGWIAGFHDFALATLWSGGQLVLHPTGNFEAESFANTVERFGVTTVLLVPTVLRRVLAYESLEQHDLSSLRLILSGGEPVPVTDIHTLHRRLPTCHLQQAYGMTEFPTMMLWLSAEDATSKAGSVGKACRAAEVRIVDETGADTQVDEVGEIICRSPACTVGYFRDDDATSTTLADGWLHTGDLARVDAEGYVYITGRAKDMILTGGLNVYPAEIERLIEERPEVHEAAVIGVPHAEWGEIGKAIIVLKPDQELEEATLLASLKEDLATFKVPRIVEFSETPLPRTLSGKVQKFLLS
jgi:fatty-acyl-CoA synthase